MADLPQYTCFGDGGGRPATWEWMDWYVCKCLPVSEGADHQKYVWHLRTVATTLLSLTVLNISQVQISTTLSSSRCPTWSQLWWETSTSLSTCSVKVCSKINDKRAAECRYSGSGKCTVTLRACLQLTYLSAYLWSQTCWMFGIYNSFSKTKSRLSWGIKQRAVFAAVWAHLASVLVFILLFMSHFNNSSCPQMRSYYLLFYVNILNVCFYMLLLRLRKQVTTH